MRPLAAVSEQSRDEDPAPPSTRPGARRQREREDRGFPPPVLNERSFVLAVLPRDSRHHRERDCRASQGSICAFVHCFTWWLAGWHGASFNAKYSRRQRCFQLKSA